MSWPSASGQRLGQRREFRNFLCSLRQHLHGAAAPSALPPRLRHLPPAATTSGPARTDDTSIPSGRASRRMDLPRRMRCAPIAPGISSPVREVFETCDVFVFTLGLTEGWVSTLDGAVYPLAPGVAGIGPQADAYALREFFGRRHGRRPLGLRREAAPGQSRRARRPHRCRRCRWSRLMRSGMCSSRRPTASRLCGSWRRSSANRLPDVASFPAYEIITGPQAGYRFFFRGSQASDGGRRRLP